MGWLIMGYEYPKSFTIQMVSLWVGYHQNWVNIFWKAGAGYYGLMKHLWVYEAHGWNIRHCAFFFWWNHHRETVVQEFDQNMTPQCLNDILSICILPSPGNLRPPAPPRLLTMMKRTKRSMPSQRSAVRVSSRQTRKGIFTDGSSVYGDFPWSLPVWLFLCKPLCSY